MAAKTGRAMSLELLLKKESSSEKIDNPEILYGQANQSKKGEDFTFVKADCKRVTGEGVTPFSVFALFDGHNGSAAAIYSEEHLLNNILSSIPAKLSRDEWVAALPRAFVAGFVKTDKDFQTKARSSGTTVTFVIIDGWVITVASVGDSQCILESTEGSIYLLSSDHRFEVNEEEVERVKASGGGVGRMNAGGGAEIGPLRCWPGGLCISRSIGDMNAGELIVPIPYVKQVKLSNNGGRLIISSDGVWDALSFETACNCSRGLSVEAAAHQIVKEAVQVKGLRDDTTCIVVDLIPSDKLTPSAPRQKKQGMAVFKNMFRRKSNEPSSQSDYKDSIESDMVEELFEEGSASLEQRLEVGYPICNLFKLFVCAVCQVELKPGEGISIHSDSSEQQQLENSRAWDGPFLCQSCHDKKEAMEGKKSSSDDN